MTAPHGDRALTPCPRCGVLLRCLKQEDCGAGVVLLLALRGTSWGACIRHDEATLRPSGWAGVAVSSRDVVLLAACLG